MATVHSTVEAAEKAMWGSTAEAQALLELYSTASCDESFATLAVGILGRYIAAWGTISTELLRHGCPSLKQRQGDQ